MATAVLAAGSGQTDVAGYVDGPLLDARFHSPWGLCTHPSAHAAVYVCDYGNSAIRLVDLANNAVSTVAVLDWKPIHVSLFPNGDLLVAALKIGDVLCPLYRVTPAGIVTQVGRARQPRGVHTDGTNIRAMTDGDDYFGETWLGGSTRFVLGADGSQIHNHGVFSAMEGLTAGGDGRFYGLAYNGYYYNGGSGVHVFNPDMSYFMRAEGPMYQPGDVDGYAGRVQMVHVSSSLAGEEFYSTAWDGIHHFAIDTAGKIQGRESIYSGHVARGLCQVGNHLYFSSTDMYPSPSSGGTSAQKYFYPGGLPHSGLDSIYRVDLSEPWLRHRQRDDSARRRQVTSAQSSSRRANRSYR